MQWPGGNRAAFALSFDCDAESAILAVDPVYRHRLSTMSHQRYGPRVGVPRILRLLERLRLSATFFVPGLTADLHPEMVKRIVAAGHEVGHHGYSHVPYHRLEPAARRADLERGLEALERAGAGRPAGFRAPWWELPEGGPGLLAEHRFGYDSSLMDDDRPYLIETGGAPLVELPVHWIFDDWEQYAFLPEPVIGAAIETPAKALALWSAEVSALSDDGGLSILTCHPFLSGRASRVAAIERLVEHVRGLGGVWIAPLGDIAAHAAAELSSEPPRSVTPVEIEEDVYGF